MARSIRNARRPVRHQCKARRKHIRSFGESPRVALFPPQPCSTTPCQSHDRSRISESSILAELPKADHLYLLCPSAPLFLHVPPSLRLLKQTRHQPQKRQKPGSPRSIDRLEQLVGFVVVDDVLGGRVPLDGAAQCLRHVAEVARRHRAVGRFRRSDADFA